jgi:hypothetical protein
MSFSNSPRPIRILLLTALVLLPALPVHAAPNGAARFHDGSIFTAFLDELQALWSGFWGDSGCTIDPDGRMRSVQEREGITIDPDGRNGGTPPPPPPVSGPDEGITIDPNG